MVLSVKTEFVQLVENLADMPIVLDHAVGINTQSGLVLGLLLSDESKCACVWNSTTERTASLAFAARSIKSNAPAVTSSSTVSIRLIVSGPVSSIFPSAE